MNESCPVCKSELKNKYAQGERYFFECPRCGPYSLSYEAKHDLARYLDRDDTAPARLSYALYRMTKRQQGAMVTNDLLENILKNMELPRPHEQLENLVLWLGENQPSMGAAIQVADQVIAAVGTTDMESVGFLTSQAIEAGLINGEVVQQTSRSECYIPSAQLTLEGWKQFDELQRGKSSSRMAFMAMQFGDPELDRIYQDHFKRAVAASGFDLKRLDEGQPAGLIDDRLRVEIRQSRFLIADLTHHNKGAYWEAGYAEGLGKPVIYTCRKDVFDGKAIAPHFDTNHHLTVVWSPNDLATAEAKLTATIRATLPDEAKLGD